jgi:hypothetical protein
MQVDYMMVIKSHNHQLYHFMSNNFSFCLALLLSLHNDLLHIYIGKSTSEAANEIETEVL